MQDVEQTQWPRSFQIQWSLFHSNEQPSNRTYSLCPIMPTSTVLMMRISEIYFGAKRFCMSIRNIATKQSHRFSLMGLLMEPCLASQCYHYLAIVCVTLCDPSKPLGYAPWLDRRLPSSEKMILKVYRIAASVNIDYWGQNSFIGA